MGKPTGFIEIARRPATRRPVEERLRDWNEVYLPAANEELREQGARCMDCSVPFCHQHCPLGNVIPDWNDLVYRDRWLPAVDRLLSTNNFPEFTGRLCPAPCESACVLSINSDAVTIKQVELAVIERAFAQGWITPKPPTHRSGKRVAVVGSGPAGLAAAAELNAAGHTVNVFERADRLGGLLRYGIPDFKMEKHVLDRRLALMEAEGITFHANAHIGSTMPVDALRRSHDAIVLAGGAAAARDLSVPGRELAGIHFAMEYLTQQNRRGAGEPGSSFISASGLNVAIIGGGDTGADCLGTALRQGAKSVRQLELLPQPPDQRTATNPWPEWPNIFRVSSAHEEGGERMFAVSTEKFSGNAEGRVNALHAVHVESTGHGPERRLVPQRGTEVRWDVDLVLLALGFNGAEQGGLLSDLGVRMTGRGTVWRDAQWMTSAPGVFVAGDMQRGPSLIVWAIADGRSAARQVHAYLNA